MACAGCDFEQDRKTQKHNSATSALDPDTDDELYPLIITVGRLDRGQAISARPLAELKVTTTFLKTNANAIKWDQTVTAVQKRRVKKI